MIKYQTSIYNIITNDDEYQKWMKEIAKIEQEFASSSSFNNEIALDHGVNHMNRVAKVTFQLMKEYGCPSKLCELGYIAGLIHDIGIRYGKKDHALNGSVLAVPFLSRLNIIDSLDIAAISQAIKSHGKGDDKKSMIGMFLALADKIDMCASRSLAISSPIKLINSYDVKIEHHTLFINYDMDSLDGVKGLYMVPKSIDVPILIASDLNLKIKFFVNNQEENFASRKDYRGKTYNKMEA